MLQPEEQLLNAIALRLSLSKSSRMRLAYALTLPMALHGVLTVTVPTMLPILLEETFKLTLLTALASMSLTLEPKEHGLTVHVLDHNAQKFNNQEVTALTTVETVLDLIIPKVETIPTHQEMVLDQTALMELIHLAMALDLTPQMALTLQVMEPDLTLPTVPIHQEMELDPILLMVLTHLEMVQDPTTLILLMVLIKLEMPLDQTTPKVVTTLITLTKVQDAL